METTSPGRVWHISRAEALILLVLALFWLSTHCEIDLSLRECTNGSFGRMSIHCTICLMNIHQWWTSPLTNVQYILLDIVAGRKLLFLNSNFLCFFPHKWMPYLAILQFNTKSNRSTFHKLEMWHKVTHCELIDWILKTYCVGHNYEVPTWHRQYNTYKTNTN